MRCKDAEHYLAEYIAGTLPADSEFVEHLAECYECRDEAETLRSTWNDLRGIAVPARPAVMNPNLAAALAAVKPEPYNSDWRKIMPYALTSLLIAFVLAGGFYTGPSVMYENAGAHFRGSPNAPLTLVEYGDYECPPCATYNRVIKDVLQRNDSRIRLEFHQFPLPIHPNAFLAASAAEAAGEQGHYWEMNDLLFEYQSIWRDNTNAEAAFTAYAVQLGLDQARFVQSMHSPEVRQRIMNDLQTAKDARFGGTPTFLLNGKPVEVREANVEQLEKAIEAASNKK